jgi:hypothetical protein
LLAAPHVLSQDLPEDDIALLLCNSYEIKGRIFKMSPSYNLKRILHDLGDGQCGITEHAEGKSDNFARGHHNHLP